MSRIGKKPILIPSGVTVTVEGSNVTVKGPKGELFQRIRPEIAVKISDSQVTFEVARETKETNAFWGLSRALVANMIKGVTEGFEKKLELVGVGYRVKPNGNGITLTVGFSHPVDFPAPEGIKLEVLDQNNLTISGADRQMVGQVAAKIRKIRKPEPYKGKGIKYAGEVIRRKAGKSGKA
jgi:large subunit ribosomal protein L6